MIDAILNSVVSSGVVDRLGWVLLHSVWQFALIALICAATMAATSPRTAAARYATYGGMLSLMGLLPLATWIAIGSGAESAQSNVPAVVVGEPDLLTVNEATDVVALTPAAPIADVPSVELPMDSPSAEAPAATIPPSTPTVQNESDGPADIPFHAVIAPWLSMIVGVWCLGVAMFSLRPTLSWWMVQRLKSVGVASVGEDVAALVSRLKEQLGLHRSVRLLQSTLVNSPIVVGCFRSVILLPTSLLTALPAAQLESILAHELAHVRRFDYLINLLQTGVETLFFYHPAVWWMSRRMRIERENCCDDVVIGVLGDQVQYGRALLAIEEHRGATAALALGANDGSLLSRVGRILSVDDAGPLKSSPLGVIAVATACLLVVTSGVFLMTTVQAGKPADDGWGEVSHGLQCRVVAIDASQADNEESDFDTFADVMLAVEFRNVSRKPLQLAGLPRAKAGSESLPHWFRLDVRSEDGSPLPRTHREFFEPWQLAHGDVLKELAPGETKRVTLRPAQWRAPMNYELPAGRYRVVVTFRGPDESLIRDLEKHGSTHRLVSAWRHQVRSNDVALNIAANIHRTPRLVWGANTSGLKAALEIRTNDKENADPTSLPGIPAGTGLHAIVHLQNVSDKPISVVSETGRQGDVLSVTNEKGEPIEIRDAFFSGWPIDVAWTVQPGETAQLDLLTPRLRTNLAPGRYDVTCKVCFDSRVSTDGDGNRKFPRADDYFSNIQTGVAMFFIAPEGQEGLDPESSAHVKHDPGDQEFPRGDTSDAVASAGPLRPVDGNDDEPESNAPFRLPDHWIIEDLRWVKNDSGLITVALQGGVDVRRWDVANRKLVSEIKLQSDVHGRPIRQGSLRLSPDGLRILGVTDIEYSKRFADTKETRFVFVWDTRDGKLLNKLPIPQKDWAYNTVCGLDCSADGSIIVAGLSTDYTRMGHGLYSGHGIAWDADSGKVLSRFEIENSSDVSCVSVTPDGKRFATCTRGHRVGVWETSTGKQLQDFTQHAFNWSSPDPKIIKNNVVRGVALRPDGRQLAIAGTFGIRLVDVETGELTASIDAPYRYGSPDITYAPDGQRFARSGVRAIEDSPSAVAVYSSESGEWLTNLIHGSDCVAFAQSGQQIAIADADFYEAVSVWPIESGKTLGPLPDPKRRPRINRVEENTHTTGDAAESFVKRWQPVWGEPVNGIQYGLAFTSEQPAADGTPPQTPQFDEEERITMAAFLKNVSERPIQIDCRPDMFGNLPLVRSTGGTVVSLGKQKLIGSPSHYRDVLEPDEHFGPLYLQVAVGSNPRPSQQYWTPFWPNPVHGEYSVAHKITVLTRPPQPKPDVDKPDWTRGEVTSGSLNFRIGDERVATGDSGGNSEGSNLNMSATGTAGAAADQRTNTGRPGGTPQQTPERRDGDPEPPKKDKNAATDAPNSAEEWRLADADGRPISGATVRLIAQDQTFRNLIKHKLLYETTTDAEGRFELPDNKSVANERDDFGMGGCSATWVTVPERDGQPARTWLLGSSAGIRFPWSEALWAAWSGKQPSDPESLAGLIAQKDGNPVLVPHTIRLPNHNTIVRFSRPNGQPAAGVTVVPSQINWISTAHGRKPLVVPDIVRSSLQQVTDGDGNANFSTMPMTDIREMEVESPEFGLQRTFSNDTMIAPDLRKGVVLYPVSHVTGQIVATNDAASRFFHGRELLLKTTTRNFGMRGMPRGTIKMEGFARVTADENGRFEIPAMSAGRLTIVDQLQRDASFRIKTEDRAAVRPGQVTEVKLTAFPTVLVRGHLTLDDPTESKARFSIGIRHGGSRSGVSRELTAHAVTDDKGYFETRVIPGRIGVNVNTVREGFVPAYRFTQKWSSDWPLGQRSLVPTGANTFDLPTINLLATTPIEGTLIDANGKPIPNAEVYSRHTEMTGNDFARTDDSGRFALTRTPIAYPPRVFKIGPRSQLTRAQVVSMKPLIIRATELMSQK